MEDFFLPPPFSPPLGSPNMGDTEREEMNAPSSLPLFSFFFLLSTLQSLRVVFSSCFFFFFFSTCFYPFFSFCFVDYFWTSVCSPSFSLFLCPPLPSPSPSRLFFPSVSSKGAEMHRRFFFLCFCLFHCASPKMAIRAFLEFSFPPPLFFSSDRRCWKAEENRTFSFLFPPFFSFFFRRFCRPWITWCSSVSFSSLFFPF